MHIRIIQDQNIIRIYYTHAACYYIRTATVYICEHRCYVIMIVVMIVLDGQYCLSLS